jgi:tetratricopeptide (TPR) repeat protein
LALALNKLGDQPTEQQALERAIELDPKFILTRNQLGLLYLLSNRVQESEKQLKKTIELDPQFAEAQNNLDTLYNQQNHHELAERLFGKRSKTTHSISGILESRADARGHGAFCGSEGTKPLVWIQGFEP